MLSYLQKSGASYVCLYHHGKTKGVKAAHTQANPNDSSGELTSLSVIPTDDTGDTAPFHEKPVPLEVAETSAFKKYAWECRLADGGKGRPGYTHWLLLGFTRRQTPVLRFS